MKNDSKDHVDPIRAQVLDKAMVSSRLLDERYFGQVVTAVKNNKENDFNIICKEANIPPEMWHFLWEIARKTVEERIIIAKW
jgi:hypothetical protein